MNYDFNLLQKYKIKPTRIIKGRRIMKDTSTLLKNVYVKKEKLQKKCNKMIHQGGSKNKINIVETELSEIENLHIKLKNLLFLNNGIIEIYSNNN